MKAYVIMNGLEPIADFRSSRREALARFEAERKKRKTADTRLTLLHVWCGGFEVVKSALVKAPKVLFHLTPATNVPSIQRKGLEPCPDDVFEDGVDGVNLTADPDKFYVANRTYATCRVKTDLLDQSKLWHVGEWWWRYDGPIPPELIAYGEV